MEEHIVFGGGDAAADKVRAALRALDALGCASADEYTLGVGAGELAGALCAAAVSRRTPPHP